MDVAKYKLTADDFSAYEEPSWVERLLPEHPHLEFSMLLLSSNQVGKPHM